MLGIKPASSRRAAGALNCSNIFSPQDKSLQRDLFTVIVHMQVFVCMSVHHMSAVPEEDRRGHKIPWNWG